jgi:hypothetical protein
MIGEYCRMPSPRLDEMTSRWLTGQNGSGAMSLWVFSNGAKMGRTVRVLGLLAATFLANEAFIANAAFAAKIEYSALAESVPHLVIRSTETESDALIRATCSQAGTVELRLGAELDVGAGNGGTATLALRSGGKTANISGVSLLSIDSPMTGGSELLATVPSSDPVFEVLTSGASIRFSGSIKGVQSVSIGLEATKSLKKLLASCKA